MNDLLPRKLVAILHADVVGYSALVRDDEDATHRVLIDCLDLISSIVASHRGRIINYAGDAVLAKFDAVTDAMTAAVSIQEALRECNSKFPDERKLHFRIGVNSGDVIEDRGDIYGDGVNVAARIQALATPGGICISDSVRTAVHSKLSLSYVDLGAQHVKNIDAPIHVYRVLTDKGEVGSVRTDSPMSGGQDKPSIAVLPFTNMSVDPEQEHFSDGISEDIITALSKISMLLVVARSSTFIYKGKTVEIKQVGREQGVRYVLEGSVRKAVNRIRVTAQLIDTTTGHSIWAEKYDRELDDIFVVQDELVREIAVALNVELVEGEQLRVWSSGTKSVEAWECVRLSVPVILSNVAEDLNKAKRWLDRALELDPDYAIAWVMLGWYHQGNVDVASGLKDPDARAKSLASMRECAGKAIELDPSCADAYSVMALYHMEQKEFDAAVGNAERSIELAPSNAENLCEAASVLCKSGKPHRALELATRATRLCPMYRAGFLRALGSAYRFTGDLDAAAENFRESVARQPELLSGHVNLASVLGELGRIDEANDVVKQILRLAPDFSINRYSQGLAYRKSEDIQRVVQGLQRAGLPDPN